MTDYLLTRGDTLLVPVQVLAVPSGLPPDSQPQIVDITGWKLWFTVKKYLADPDSLAVFQGTTVSGDVVITAATSGKALCTMPAISTRALPDGVTRLIYDVQGKDLTGIISTVERGVITVTPDVTRAIT